MVNKIISIKQETHKRLGTFGTQSDSFDSVLNMLMDKYEDGKE